MNNAAVIEKMSSDLVSRIEFLMSDRGIDYAEAKGYVKESTCAGPATWAVVDGKFSS